VILKTNDVTFRVDYDPSQLLFNCDGTLAGVIRGLASYFINDKEVSEEEYKICIEEVLKRCE